MHVCQTSLNSLETDFLTPAAFGLASAHRKNRLCFSLTGGIYAAFRQTLRPDLYCSRFLRGFSASQFQLTPWNVFRTS